MNNEIDNKYIKIKYDILSKEIIKYDKLNPFEDNSSFYFDINIDLFDLSIKGTKNDNIFELYENIMKIILDKNIELKVCVLIGYLNIIKEILRILRSENYDKLYQYNFEDLINKIINEFIITFKKMKKKKLMKFII